MDLNLPQLDAIVKTIVAHDERMAMLLQQIVVAFEQALQRVEAQPQPQLPIRYQPEVPKMKPEPEAVTNEGLQYLRENPDVAAHDDYKNRPFAHYMDHGRNEGRKWPFSAATAEFKTVAFRVVLGARIDAVVSPGTPGTVTLPVTGHTLSLPMIDPDPKKSEMFMGYLTRVSDQCDGNYKIVNPLGIGETLFKPLGGFKEDGSNWPEAADRFYNQRAYMTPEELRKALEGEASWGGYEAAVRGRLQ